jgi:hypothetical protein
MLFEESLNLLSCFLEIEPLKVLEQKICLEIAGSAKIRNKITQLVEIDFICSDHDIFFSI